MLDHQTQTVLLVATLTAVATGLGALPFLFVRSIGREWMASANAMAAGLMLAASVGLVIEGLELSPGRLIAGVLIGLGGILAGEWLVARHGEVEIAELTGLDARKALLIVGIMTVHSFAEGVGVGVSFGGAGDLAGFVSTAIAIHNIPEGLAIALVLVPRGTPVLKAALWAIFSSLPQPLMAVPAYLFVESFAPLLPIGLGLAAGAMIWMVFAEIAPEANEGIPSSRVGSIVTLSFTAMLAFQYLLLKH
jgi:zinc transporter ZupT